MTPLPALLSLADIQDRMLTIFPEGTANRNFLVREMGARTVFVMLYIDAVHGAGYWLRPDQVTRMTDVQAASTDEEDRAAWRDHSMQPSKDEIPGRWYAVNTREPIRDETLREGLVRTGAVREREGLPTTSPKPRYALDPEFAALFAPELKGEALESAIATWQEANLSTGALARIAILRQAVVAGERRVLVRFTDGETRHMYPGPSSVIAKAVVEEFTLRFLERPGVIWLSESRNKVVARDDLLAQSIGLHIDPDRNLPDIILVDLGPTEPSLVFVEVVATAGQISETRRHVLTELAADAGFTESQVAFVTAYPDRSHPAFRQSVSELAWWSFAWFTSEQDHIVALHKGGEDKGLKLSVLMEIPQ